MEKGIGGDRMDGIIAYLLAKKAGGSATIDGMTYKGSVATVSNLPAAAAANKGWVYTISANGHEHVSDGTQWVDLSADLANYQLQNIQRTVTIAVADWNSGTTCTKEVLGVTASNTVIVDSSDATVTATAQGTDSLTFTATATPTAEVTVKVVILP